MSPVSWDFTFVKLTIHHFDHAISVELCAQVFPTLLSGDGVSCK